MCTVVRNMFEEVKAVNSLVATQSHGDVSAWAAAGVYVGFMALMQLQSVLMSPKTGRIGLYGTGLHLTGGSTRENRCCPSLVLHVTWAAK